MFELYFLVNVSRKSRLVRLLWQVHKVFFVQGSERTSEGKLCSWYLKRQNVIDLRLTYVELFNFQINLGATCLDTNYDRLIYECLRGSYNYCLSFLLLSLLIGVDISTYTSTFSEFYCKY